jgi:hypothetical protein
MKKIRELLDANSCFLVDRFQTTSYLSHFVRRYENYEGFSPFAILVTPLTSNLTALKAHQKQMPFKLLLSNAFRCAARTFYRDLLKTGRKLVPCLRITTAPGCSKWQIITKSLVIIRVSTQLVVLTKLHA